ncbi:hypothetical protein GCM10010169_53970 [Micromonospora fulviviridis]|uniref:hypothetical protein n=1 Tax=Micromonospora fulviviridis TaxID=47860 RepID=UPI0019C14C8D|nr:hypothetical protein [Micromonospora fulviviridis]GGS02517.1 hypothetical protein GCM10010169_53970 [Micromonospora fulviviridis]
MLPLPEVIWLALLEHQERQQAERAALAEVWEDHKVYAHANLDAMRQALGKLDGRLS